MNELTMVEHLFTEPAPAPAVTAEGRARLLRLAGDAAPTSSPAATAADRARLPRLTGDAAPALAPAGRPRTRRLLWTVLPAAALTTAAAVTIGILTSDPHPADTSARRVLLAAAAESAKAPPSGRYYVFTRQEGRAYTVGSKEHPYTVLSRRIDELWYPTAPGAAGRIASQDLGVRPATPADAAAWRAAGSPDRVTERCDEGAIIGYKGSGRRPDGITEEVPIRRHCRRLDVRPGPRTTAPLPSAPGTLGRPPVGLDPARLSGDPAVLRRQLLSWTRAGGLVGPVRGDSAQLWAAAGTLVASPVGPVRPAVRAAAYRVLADLPDVRSLGPVTDQRGRRGQALTRTGSNTEAVAPGTYRLTVDPRTGAPLATTYQGTGSGEYSLILRYGYTDQPPQ
ncbi:CU044_5270 family protein [Actinomadura parmotrematis]|uniref:CU044_5270 family protein n=1 Tax=Actinomadura parmotrematis TaxID=2864039 RepID=A0ABS7G264_9ACTN|nr:CU044_5270 family protein [Actinomadura parmotrematis]MBW8486799.1 CU044_5270 family protein [Actinomadura parmotrematis]